MHDAIARGDYQAALADAASRILDGGQVAIEDVAPALPGAETVGAILALIGNCTGDRARVLLELVETGTFPATEIDRELALGCLYAVHKLDQAPATRGRIAIAARGLSHGALTDVAAALVRELALSLDSEPLRKMTADIVVPAKARASLVKVLDERLAGDRTALRELANPPPPPASAFTVRAGPKQGRNDLCACGSGKKYKKCCAAKESASSGSSGSPVPGLSWIDYLRTAGAKMTVDDLDRLVLTDLLQVDPTQLSDDPLVVLMRRLVQYRRLADAERVLDVAAARASLAGDIVELRLELAVSAFDLGRRETARRLYDALDPAAIVGAHRLRHAVLTGRDPLPIAAELAEQVVRDEGDTIYELAFGLMDAVPALGIVIARGCLDPARPLDSEAVLDEIEYARDRLDVSEGDPSWEVWARLTRRTRAEEDAGDEPAGENDADAARVRDELAESARRTADLERRLAEATDELKRSAAPAAIEAPERRKLREQIALLEARIREGNTERAELRRNLAAQRSHAPASSAEPEQPAEAPEGDAVGELPRAALVPVFGKAAIAALDDVPGHVAAQAIRIVGQLGAGDANAWAGTKQAQDLQPPLLFARIGIHHRVLFRIGDGTIDVLDLVTRENLLTTIKRYRG